MQSLLNTLPLFIKYLFLFYLFCKGMDFILGILKTWKNPGTYKSRIMRDGIIRWIAELLAIAFVIAFDLMIGLQFVLISSTLGLFVYKEAGSIIENLRDCGVTLPNMFSEHLEKLNPDSKGENKDGNL